MKQQVMKRWLREFLMTGLGFLLLVLFCAAAEGALPLLPAAALGLACLLALNLLCGAPARKAAQKTAPAARARRVCRSVPVGSRPALRVVRGGRAA